jgi:ERF superfamily
MMTETIHSAMAKAFAEIEGAIKDRGNPAFKADGAPVKYATLESVVQAVRPALIAHDLWFNQISHDRAGGVCVETIVRHSSGGEFAFGPLFLPASKQDAQGYGSALTYARRYSLMTAFGICPEDDDGNSATPPSKDDVHHQPSQSVIDAKNIMDTFETAAELKEWATGDDIMAMRVRLIEGDSIAFNTHLIARNKVLASKRDSAA